MAVTLNLSQFKASGVYTIELNQTSNIVVAPETIRLVVGFSKQGPFNTPVYCPDLKTAQTVFGSIDTSLEKKESFFHRSLFTCLQTGPCFALNLLIVNDDTTSPSKADEIDYVSLSVDTAEGQGSSVSNHLGLTGFNPATSFNPIPKLYSSFFNKQKFWFNDPSYFLATRSIEDQGKLFNITNVGQQPMSVIVKKSNVSGYDVTAKQWYQTIGQPLPSFLNPTDFISDYFIDVYAIAGNWTNYNALSVDPVYGQYFTQAGFIYQARVPNPSQDLLNQFVSRPEIQLIASFTGCLIPNFQDQTGNNQYIQTLINNTIGTTGLFCAVNEAAFYNNFTGTSTVDLVGHHLVGALQLDTQTSIDLISYEAPLINDTLYADISPSYFTYQSPFNVLIAPIGSGIYDAWAAGAITDGDFISTVYGGLTQKQFLRFFPGTEGNSGPFPSLPSGTQYVEVRAYTDTTYVTQESIFTSGRTITSTGTLTLSYTARTGTFQIGDIITDVAGNTGTVISTTPNGTSGTLVLGTLSAPIGQYIFFSGTVTGSLSGAHATAVAASGWDITALYGDYNQFFDIITPNPAFPALNTNQVLLSAANAADINIGDLLVNLPGTLANDYLDARLTRVLTKAAYADGSGNVVVTTQSPINIYPGNEVQKFQRLQDFVKTLNWCYLPGFTLQAESIPDGTTARMEEIYNVMWNTNIATSLADPNILTFRYVVDTFGGGIEPECKFPLGQLAILKAKCIAILNAPSAADFVASTDPVFTDAPTPSNPKPLLDTAFIVTGGNQNLNPTFSFGLVSQADGSEYVGYFFPNLILLDNNRNISVPPAAWVSNLYVQKFLNGTPFAIVAGPRRGLITDPNLVGVEYPLDLNDRANLEPFGINPIVNQKGVGVMIFGNDTAYQTVSNALNNLHVRDMLVTIETDIEAILSNYLFEFNDASTRLEISSVVNSYLEGVLSAGGINNFEVIMDTTNNTPDVIDQNFGIIDVIVEPVHGIQKFINRVTIANTGSIASGGFSVQSV